MKVVFQLPLGMNPATSYRNGSHLVQVRMEMPFPEEGRMAAGQRQGPAAPSTLCAEPDGVENPGCHHSCIRATDNRKHLSALQALCAGCGVEPGLLLFFSAAPRFRKRSALLKATQPE